MVEVFQPTQFSKKTSLLLNLKAEGIGPVLVASDLSNGQARIQLERIGPPLDGGITCLRHSSLAQTPVPLTEINEALATNGSAPYSLVLRKRLPWSLCRRRR